MSRADQQGDELTIGRSGAPDTLGPAQRAADGEAQLFRGDGAHAPDTVIDHGEYAGLTVRAASVRGTYGRYVGGAREDDYALGRSDDGRWLVVALADGLTSASASHLAATLAVRTALQQTLRLLAEGPVDRLELHGVFQSAAYQLRRGAEPMLQRKGLEPTADHIAGLFATTLLVAVVPTERAPGEPVRLARVGDSNAWRLGSGGWEPLLTPKLDDAPVTSSAVNALPRLPERVESAVADIDANHTLVLASDGVTDPFGPAHEGAVADYLRARWHPVLPEPLEFARHVSFRGQSWDDDRTAIAIANIPGSAPSIALP